MTGEDALRARRIRRLNERAASGDQAAATELEELVRLGLAASVDALSPVSGEGGRVTVSDPLDVMEHMMRQAQEEGLHTIEAATERHEVAVQFARAWTENHGEPGFNQPSAGFITEVEEELGVENAFGWEEGDE